MTNPIVSSRPNAANYFSYNGMEWTDLSQPLSSCLMQACIIKTGYGQWSSIQLQDQSFLCVKANEILWG